MEYTVKGIAELAGVSPRTLRWYDKTGLLKPTRVNESGYRFYGAAAVDRLQQILFFRELGFSLAEIKRILDSPDFSETAALQSHLLALTRQRERIDALILTVQKTLDDRKGENKMNDSEKFEAFKRGLVRENEERYGAESRAAYGDGAVDAANSAVLGMREDQHAAWTALDEAIHAALAEAVRAQCAPDGPQGQKVAQMHREWLSYTIPRYDPRQHAGIAALYAADARFTAYYDRDLPGCAQFLCDAVKSYTKRL